MADRCIAQQSTLIVMQRKPPSRQREAGLGRATETCHLNSSVEILKSEAWQLLLSRIGDAMMLHLLMHAAIFKPLPNGCFLQIAGTAVDQVLLLLLCRLFHACSTHAPKMLPCRGSACSDLSAGSQEDENEHSGQCCPGIPSRAPLQKLPRARPGSLYRTGSLYPSQPGRILPGRQVTGIRWMPHPCLASDVRSHHTVLFSQL